MVRCAGIIKKDCNTPCEWLKYKGCKRASGSIIITKEKEATHSNISSEKGSPPYDFVTPQEYTSSEVRSLIHQQKILLKSYKDLQKKYDADVRKFTSLLEKESSYSISLAEELYEALKIYKASIGEQGKELYICKTEVAKCNKKEETIHNMAQKDIKKVLNQSQQTKKTHEAEVKVLWAKIKKYVELKNQNEGDIRLLQKKIKRYVIDLKKCDVTCTEHKENLKTMRGFLKDLDRRQRYY
jgi:hypothetical protein